MLEETIKLLEEYNFSISEQREFLKIVHPIISHPEFIKRCDNKVYPHHGNISLGEHIIKDALITYKLIKTKKKYQKANLNIAVLIAMFHDLYELPWQNSPNKKHHFINKHGFVHPIEASINAISWFPKYFKHLPTANIIIDGIIHHMYPFPVRRIPQNISKIEINNLAKYKKLPRKYQLLITKSTNNLKFLNLNWSKSLYLEGKVVSKADKLVAFGKELRNFKALQACITGRLKRL